MPIHARSHFIDASITFQDDTCAIRNLASGVIANVATLVAADGPDSPGDHRGLFARDQGDAVSTRMHTVGGTAPIARRQMCMCMRSFMCC